MQKVNEKKTLSLLLSGKHRSSKKFAGRHVLVVDDEIQLLENGKKGTNEIARLEKKHGKTPTIVFVPKKDTTYILVLCEK